MTIKDITTYIESQIPLALQESYDNCGLIIGNPDSEIKSILVCIDVTSEIIEEAIEKGANFIISHHPLIFSGIKKLTASNDIEKLVVKAIENKIAVYALHTNADNHMRGVNALLCAKLGIQSPKILKPQSAGWVKLVTFCPKSCADDIRNALFSAGAGNIGNYDSCSFNIHGEGTFKAKEGTNPYVGAIGKLHTEEETRIETILYAHQQKKVVEALLKAHPYEEVAYDLYALNNKNTTVGSGMIGELKEEISAVDFLQNVKQIIGIGCIKHTEISNKKVKKIAVCGGSGSFLIKDAIAAGADVFLTGDVKYHEYFLPENRMILADIGHYESEQFTKELIYTLLNKKFTTFAIQISEINTNPINYL